MRDNWVIAANDYQNAATTQTPRRPSGAGGVESEPVRLGVRDHRACSI
jgi:hypothetical protein